MHLFLETSDNGLVLFQCHGALHRQSNSLYDDQPAYYPDSQINVILGGATILSRSPAEG